MVARGGMLIVDPYWLLLVVKTPLQLEHVVIQSDTEDGLSEQLVNLREDYPLEIVTGYYYRDRPPKNPLYEERAEL